METMADQPVVSSDPTSAQDGESHPILDWFQAKQKYVLIVAVAVAAAALLGWFLVESGRRKQIFLAEALDRARAAFETGDLPKASSEFQRLAQSYAGTDAAMEATLALNQVRMMSGQSKLAIDELNKFIATDPPAVFLSAAQGHLGAALENTGKFAEAGAAYSKTAESATESYRKVDALLNASRAYHLAGKDKEASDVLQNVIKNYKDVPGVAEAEVRLAELTKGRL